MDHIFSAFFFFGRGGNRGGAIRRPARGIGVWVQEAWARARALRFGLSSLLATAPRFLLSRSLWARCSPRLPSDSGHKQNRYAILGLYPSLQSIRGGAPKLALKFPATAWRRPP